MACVCGELSKAGFPATLSPPSIPFHFDGRLNSCLFLPLRQRAHTRKRWFASELSGRESTPPLGRGLPLGTFCPHSALLLVPRAVEGPCFLSLTTSSQSPADKHARPQSIPWALRGSNRRANPKEPLSSLTQLVGAAAAARFRERGSPSREHGREPRPAPCLG